MEEDARLLAAKRKHLEGDWTGAEALYRDAIQHGPDVAQARHFLGFLLLQAGRLGEAHEQLRQAIALDAGHAEWHFNLGIVLSRLGEVTGGFCRNKAFCYAQAVKMNNVIDEAEPESSSGARAQAPALPA